MISTFQNNQSGNLLKNGIDSSYLLNELKGLDLTSEIRQLQKRNLKETAMINSLGKELFKLLGDTQEKDKLILNQCDLICVLVSRLYLINKGLIKLRNKLKKNLKNGSEVDNCTDANEKEETTSEKILLNIDYQEELKTLVNNGNRNSINVPGVQSKTLISIAENPSENETSAKNGEHNKTSWTTELLVLQELDILIDL